MPNLYYHDALKRGQKEFRACAARGEQPYLPVLSEFVGEEQLGRTVSLGTVQVPLEFVVGTKSLGRTQSFSRSFMPLMGPNTEFAGKWQRLCQAHLEEGIWEPIKAWEYRNRFYVEEGHKRVSVLKFFDANTVSAQVTRILPIRDGSREIELYYEFVDFYQYSRINFLEFSKPGGYAALQKALGKAPGQAWNEEDRRDFSTAFYHFHQAYEAQGGGRLTSTVGDALLAYLKVYGYDTLVGKGAADIQAAVARVWEEITLQQEAEPIDVRLSPPQAEKKSPGLLSWFLPRGEQKVLRAAFLHDKDPRTSDWTYGHELGRRHLEKVFGGGLETSARCNVMEGDPLSALEEAIAEGSNVIFTTSPLLLPASLRAAVDHPEVTILNCSLNTSHRYIRTYYARMYEVKFITGAMAGAMAGDDPVGYICDSPIYGQVAGINAFALGVQLTNPLARVHLEWSSVDDAKTAVQRLTEKGIRLISAQDLARRGAPGHNFGLSVIEGDHQVNLAMPVWKWGIYYEALLRRIQDRSFQMEYRESHKALNYYWGLSSGVVDLRCSYRLPDCTRKLADLLRDGIRSGLCHPFRGPIYDQRGTLQVEEGDALDVERIITMDWLADNVVGSIPAYEALSDTGKATVGIVGVEATKEKES